MTVGTGRNQISKAIITLSSTSGVQFRSSQAKLESDGMQLPALMFPFVIDSKCVGSSGALECNESKITLVNVDKETVISVLVPHSDASALHSMVRNVAAETTFILIRWIHSKLTSPLNTPRNRSLPYHGHFGLPVEFQHSCLLL